MSNIADVLESLSPDDFDPMSVEARGLEILEEVARRIETAESPAQAFPAVFKFVERLDGCDLGSPGPLVHTLEAVGGYTPELITSIMRKPTSLTLWMLNRVLNSANLSKRRSMYLKLLKRSASHPLASDAVQSEAGRFLEYQMSRAN